MAALKLRVSDSLAPFDLLSPCRSLQLADWATSSTRLLGDLVCRESPPPTPRSNCVLWPQFSEWACCSPAWKLRLCVSVLEPPALTLLPILRPIFGSQTYSTVGLSDAKTTWVRSSRLRMGRPK